MKPVSVKISAVQAGERADEDPAVVRLAVARGIAFDLCPISNVKLGVAPSLRELEEAVGPK